MRFGRYELLRPLGRGGMAEVFLARYVGPEGFEKQLVIKKVLPQLADDRQLLRMFFEEAKTHVGLSHGNLVPVFDFGRVGNDYFIAMEYVHGADLGAVLSAERSLHSVLPPALVAHVGIEICRGLSYVHRRGFIHRDMSPRNVLLSIDGDVKLSDFGLVLSQSSDVSGIRGTLAYIAPEQARGERIDGRADLYALGVILAEAATGQRQRESEDQSSALELARTPAPLVIDGPLAAIVQKATRARRVERYADADELLSDLERLLSSLGQGREACVRALAKKVQSLAPPVPTTPLPVVESQPTTAAARPSQTADLRGIAMHETYFRDQPTRHFVDDVLGTGPTKLVPAPTRLVPAPTRLLPARSRRIGFVLGGLVGAGVATFALLHRRPPTALPAPIVATPAASPDLATPVVVATPRVEPAKPAPHGAGAMLTIRCTPWCVPIVDGKTRGADGRSHRLLVSAGSHHVTAQRLEDRAQRTVQLRAGESKSIDFDFTNKFD